MIISPALQPACLCLTQIVEPADDELKTASLSLSLSIFLLRYFPPLQLVSFFFFFLFHSSFFALMRPEREL